MVTETICYTDTQFQVADGGGGFPGSVNITPKAKDECVLLYIKGHASVRFAVRVGGCFPFGWFLWLRT